MEGKRLWLLFLLIGFTVSAQYNGIIVDENNQPIPYVNIWLEYGSIVTTSEEDGRFTLEDKDQTKNLIFSALGFETRIVNVTEVEKVVLKSSEIKLEEVVIKKNTLHQKMEIGYYESNGFRYHMAYFFDAIFFNLSEEEREKYTFIKEVKFNTLSENENAKIRIYFVERNEDGSPSDNFLSDEIILEVKKGNRKNVVDLSSKKITIPENGFFIVFEKLKIEQNKHYQEYYFKDKNGNKITRKGMSYEPEIPLVPVQDAVGWNKRNNNKWEKSQKTIIKNPKSFENILMKKYHDKYLVPSVNITLTN